MYLDDHVVQDGLCGDHASIFLVHLLEVPQDNNGFKTHGLSFMIKSSVLIFIFRSHCCLLFHANIRNGQIALTNLASFSLH